jgi:hypothetical protein
VTVNIKITVLRDVMPCSVVDGYLVSTFVCVQDRGTMFFQNLVLVCQNTGCHTPEDNNLSSFLM